MIKRQFSDRQISEGLCNFTYNLKEQKLRIDADIYYKKIKLGTLMNEMIKRH